MTSNDRLGYVEQLIIRKRAQKDVINKCFKYIEPLENQKQLIKYNEVGAVPIDIKIKVNCIIRFIRFFKRIFQEFSTNEINFYDHIHSSDNFNSQETYFAISQYILTEVARFIAKRDKILSKDYTFIILPLDNGKRRIKIKKIINGIALIESYIVDLEKEKKDLSLKLKNESNDLNKSILYAKEKNYQHKVKLYEKLLIKLIKETEKEINKLDSKIKILYSEEKRILHQKQMILTAIRSRVFLRIRYYYECANYINPNINIMLYNEDDLYRYTGLDFNVLNSSFSTKLENIDLRRSGNEYEN